ncbi:hypothetical protein [Mastigocladopsis repens]|uniref:hypothetical protein n=1 Tax=Mastigocladopsis repens TaxID=221287 RepID=UPI000311B50B|nr:hypothetical protein [Mastigocladopsis repens]
MPSARLTANASRQGAGNQPAALDSPQRTASAIRTVLGRPGSPLDKLRQKQWLKPS